MFHRLPARVWGSAVVAAHLPGQRRMPFRDRHDLDAARDEAVGRIAEHVRTVPFYAEWFERERLDPRDVRTAEDLARLPVLDKQTVRDDPRRFLSGSHAGRTAVRFLTSGTTGSPLEVWHDRHSLLANLAYGERERDVILRVCGRGSRPREINVTYPSSTHQKVWAFYGENALLPAPKRAYLSVLDPIDDIVRAINGAKPDVLVSYGSFLELLYRHLQTTRATMHRPRMVMYVADNMSAPGRELIENDFGIPVFSRYNAMEAFKIGFLCEERNGFHVHEDLCHLRIVRSDGSAAARGEVGEIVLSNLVNRATVLLNYRIGDLGSLAVDPCACGRTFVRLCELDGRSEDVLVATDGRYVHPRAIWGALKQMDGLLRYRLIQHGPESFELTLMARGEAAYQTIIESTLPALSRLLGATARIKCHRAESIAPLTGGKFRPVVRAFRADGAGEEDPR